MSPVRSSARSEKAGLLLRFKGGVEGINELSPAGMYQEINKTAISELLSNA